MARDIFNNTLQLSISTDQDNKTKNVSFTKKVKVGLLTNEIPPIVYGGVATWIVNFIKMFEEDNDFEVIPIFVAYNDKLPEECLNKYPKLRIINNEDDIHQAFSDIDICINNLWIAEGLVENITNLGSCYTNNFNQQEITFQNSDYIVLISKAEQDYYNKLGYSNFNTNTRVIYNSYTPQFDNEENIVDYNLNNTGYIGRHVPRKRPELPILAVDSLNKKEIKVINMGVDYDKYGNQYWKELEQEYKDNLVIIPFSSEKEVKENYWNSIGINCITGIYEPFGYTICETIDRRIPVVVSNIDGPKEIIEEVNKYVYTYDVDINNIKNDIVNISHALQKVWDTPSNIRRENSRLARKCLDKLRPETIKKEWKCLVYDILNTD